MNVKQTLRDIEENPKMHKHTHATLAVCCTVNGKDSKTLRKAHEKLNEKQSTSNQAAREKKHYHGANIRH